MSYVESLPGKKRSGGVSHRCCCGGARWADRMKLIARGVVSESVNKGGLSFFLLEVEG